MKVLSLEIFRFRSLVSWLIDYRLQPQMAVIVPYPSQIIYFSNLLMKALDLVRKLKLPRDMISVRCGWQNVSRSGSRPGDLAINVLQLQRLSSTLVSREGICDNMIQYAVERNRQMIEHTASS